MPQGSGDCFDAPIPVHFMLRSADAPGGVVRSVLTLATELARHRPVEVVSVLRRREAPAHAWPPQIRPRYLDEYGRDDVQPYSRVLRRIGPASFPSALVHRDDKMRASASLRTDLAVLRELRSMGPGVLVTTRPTLHALAAQFAPPHVMVVAQEHLNFTSRPRSLLNEMAQHARGLNAVAVLTDRDRADMTDLLRSTLGIDAPPVVTLANPVAWPTRPALVERDRVIVAAGRLMRQKGFDRLIEAFAPLAERFPDWRVEVHGDGPERDALEAMVSRLGLQGRVRLLGFNDRLPDALDRAAVFALSSRFEGLPLVAIEAMGHRLPIVAFDCPRGPRELVRDGANGFLVPDGDIPAFSQALARLMSDPALREGLGAEGRGDARSYDVPAIAGDWQRLIAQLVARARLSRPPRDRRSSARVAFGALSRSARSRRGGRLNVLPADEG